MQALEIAVPPRALPRMRATTDLAEVAHDTLPEAPRDPAWSIRERRFSPATEPSVEARFSVSNGLVGVRGSLEEEASSPHPRTLAAGLFDPLDGDVAVPGLVPAPDYLGLRMYVDGVPIGYETSGVRSQVRTLDLRRAALWREWSYDDGNGGSVRVRTLRFASAVHRALTVHVTEISADHHVELLLHQQCARCDAHLVCVSSSGHRTVWETKNRKRRLYVARSSILERAPGHCERITPTDDGSLLSVRLDPNSPVTLTRIVAMAPDWALGDQEALDATLERACRAGGSRLLDEHVDAWRRRWHASDVEVAGDDRAQRALRFAAYHLLSAANPGSDVASVGARGLTGDAYWGHVFWDTDIFLLPFYTFTWPEAARAMLMYRHRGLDAAREKARRHGYRGALFAWEAGANGEESTPDFVYGPNGSRIEIKTGAEEHHISADVAYAVWQYWRVTGDDAFMRDAGSEIMLETARFWASRAKLHDDGRYHIGRVIGPDEYHEDVDDNAYTNLLARWNLRRGLDVSRIVEERWPERWAELNGALGITKGELRAWRRIASRIAVGVDPVSNVIEQFAGYFGLAPIDLSAFEPRTQPMDVLLGHDAIQRSQVIKQADVVMLLALLEDEFTGRQRVANFRYYEPRCGHGSSLSPAIHALVSARLGDVDLAYRYFQQAASVDLDDALGNAASGIHMATQGGLWQAAVMGFAGLKLSGDGLRLDPRLPSAWRSMAFRVQWQGRQVHFEILQAPRTVNVTLERGEPFTVHVGKRSHVLERGEVWTSARGTRGRQGREAANV